MSHPDHTEAPKLSAYQRRLFVFLSVATFFEGFDYIALTQMLPTLRQDFGLAYDEGQRLVSLINVGAVLSYALIRRADAVGRKPVLALTIGGYTLFSLLSALAFEVYGFGLAQLCARTCLLAEYAVSMVVVVEEFPAARRAFAVGVIQGVNSLGAIVCAGVVPLLLKTPWGYRSVYVVGSIPLLLLALLRRGLRETQHFQAQGPRAPRSLFAIFRSPHRRRVPLLAAIWGFTYLGTYVLVSNFKDYMVTELGYDDASQARAVMFAALGSMPLVFASGKLLDAIGRRRGAVVIFLATVGSALLAFTARDFVWLTVGLTGAIFGTSAVLPVLNAITLELFPTAFRADGLAWSNNLLGRAGYVLGPALSGLLAPQLGIGGATAALSLSSLVALALILAFVPETRGVPLDGAGH
jgi:MFS transporter, putative metabolite:H+ symporter